MPRQLRVGFIGCGRIADMHTQGYHKNPHACLYAVADVQPGVCQQRLTDWGAQRFYTDYRELLADPDVDAVEILAPHHLHLPMTLAALKAGKPVSLQKPMALNLKECQQMVDCARDTGVTFRVYENFIFYPPFAQLKALMSEGAVGRPLSLRLHLGTAQGGWHVPLKTWVWRMKGHLSGGGPNLFDDGYHKFSMAVALMGRVKAVRADVRWWLGAVDTPAAVLLSFEEGGVGVFDAGHSMGMELFSDQYGADEQVVLSGDEGTLVMTRCTARHGQPPPLLLHRDGKTTAFHGLPATWQDSFTQATRHFIQCLQNGETPLLTGEDGLFIQALAQAAYRSSENGGEVVDMAGFIKGELA